MGVSFDGGAQVAHRDSVVWDTAYGSAMASLLAAGCETEEALKQAIELADKTARALSSSSPAPNRVVLTHTATVRFNTYDLIESAVEEGLRFGFARANKHESVLPELPSIPDAEETLIREIMNALSDVFSFDEWVGG